MSPPAGKRSSRWADALTAGCLLLLVLVADAAAGLLVVIVLALRGLGRMDAGAGQLPAGRPPADWTPVLCFGALALAVGVTGVVLLRLGHRVTGALQLALCLVLAGEVLWAWP
ncbi:inner-membrane translocator [Streptomyces sp. NPDC006602]|uniref:inner-membrane translocator n=1 Tax=Streptomyces sp. NPDC006602 TaxID=3364751 RepID=UPI0036B60694